MFTLYDQDGNGSIDATEMNKYGLHTLSYWTILSLLISVIRDIYQMLGEDSHGQAKEMFTMMDKDNDGKITEQEFIRASLEDADLVRMLSTRAWVVLSPYCLWRNEIKSLVKIPTTILS